MSKTKDQIITDLLNREGDKFTDDPDDLGGATKYGITQYAWDEYYARRIGRGNPGSVKYLTATMARAFYDSEYWAVYSFITDMILIEVVIDGAVNHGKNRMNKWLQKAVSVVQDGAIGPISKAAINAHPPFEVFESVIISRINEYGRIITAIPSQAKYAAGWLKRVTNFMVI